MRKGPFPTLSLLLGGSACVCCGGGVVVVVGGGGGLDYQGTQGEQTERGLDCLVYSDKLRGSLLSVQR